MDYVFKDRDDLEEVDNFRAKIEACADMVCAYAAEFGYAKEAVRPDSVFVSTGVNLRELKCTTYKDGKPFYVLDIFHRYGFGDMFYCKSDLHLAAETAMELATASFVAKANEQLAASRTAKKKITLGGA